MCQGLPERLPRGLRRRQRADQRLEQLGAAGRLFEPHRDTGGTRAGNFTGSGNRGQHQARNARQQRILLHPFGQFDAADAGHLHIDHGGLNRLGRCRCLRHHRQGLKAIDRDAAVGTPALQLQHQNAAIDGVVVDDQDAPRHQRAGRRWCEGGCRCCCGGQHRQRCRRQRQTKTEGGAQAGRAAHADAAAHHAHQMLADDQSETGTADAACGAGIARLERAKQALLDRLGHAAAGIADRKAHPGGAGRSHRAKLRAGRLRTHDDFSSVGELDRVAHQIGQHLAQARGVDLHRSGQIGADFTDQLDTLLMRARRQQVDHVFHQRWQGGIFQLQFEPARFDF